MKKILCVSLLFLLACEPGGALLLKDGTYKKQVYLGEMLLQLSIWTKYNKNFSLRVEIFPKNQITINLDSLDISLNDRGIDYKVFFEGKQAHNMCVETNEYQYVSYGFAYRDSVLKKVIV